MTRGLAMVGRLNQDQGRRAAETFLSTHRDDLGKRSSLDLDALLEGV